MNNKYTNKSNDTKITALYERLSQEDESQGDSNSIVNQKNQLEKYAITNNFSNIQHFSDDGFSGINFERPSWKRMIAEVEAGNVSTIIVKDMSRVGRDYLQVGFYTEVMFREKNIRFIAVNNAIDSANGSNEFAPFLNIMAEWYARDNSKKITTVMRAKGKEGKRLTSHPIYGFMSDPQDKNNWIIDEEAAQIVRRIFQLTIEGNGPHQIARILTNNSTQRPSYYLAMRGRGSNKTRYDPDKPHTWNASTISDILSKPEYIGHTVNFRYYKDSYKDKNCKKAPKENWQIFENTHPKIVDSGTFETAQRCRKTKKRTNSLGVANPLTGKMFCADCESKMYNHRKLHKTPHYNWNGTGKTYTRGPSDIYSCSTHDNNKVKFIKACSTHSIRTAVVRELILDTIKAASGLVKSSEAEFVKQMRESSALQQNETAKSHKKRT